MSGSTKRRQTAKAARRSNLRPTAPRSVPLDAYDFRFTVRRGRGGAKLADISLDDLASEASWQRSGTRMTGRLSLNDPLDRVMPGLVVKGDVVVAEVRTANGAFQPFWSMTVTTPTHALRDETRDLDLKTRLDPATRSHSGWRYRKGRAHPRGWKAHRLAEHAANRFEVPIGRLAEGKHWIEDLRDKSASVVTIVTAAYRQERLWTGRRFDVSIARGFLEVTELRRPTYILAIRDTVIDAILQDALPAAFASAVIVESTVKAKGSTKRRKIRVKVVDKDRVRRFGYVARTVKKKGLKTNADARRFGRSWLARHAKPVSSLTVTVPGVPWVDRGDAFTVDLPQAGYPNGMEVFVRSAVHRLTYGSYEMDLELGINDPWTADERAARERRRKAAAARRRNRVTHTKATPPKPKKAARRS